MNTIKLGILFIGLTLLALACQRDRSAPLVSPVPYINQANFEWADSLLATMSTEEKVGQLIHWVPKQHDSLALVNAVKKNHIGGLELANLKLLEYLFLVDTLQSLSNFPLFLSAESENLLNHHFSDVQALVPLSVINANANDSLFQHLNQLAAKQATALQINLFFGNKTHYDLKNGDQLQKGKPLALSEKRVIHLAQDFSDYYPIMPDSTKLQSLLLPAKQLVAQKNGGFVLDPLLPPPPIIEGEIVNTFDQYFEKNLGFDGLLFRKASNPDFSVQHLIAGVDIIIIEEDPIHHYQAILDAVNSGLISMEALEKKLRKILMAKKWIHNGFDNFLKGKPSTTFKPVQAAIPSTSAPNASLKSEPLSTEGIYKHFIDSKWDYFNYELNQKAITLLSNANGSLPIRNISGKSFRIIKYSDHSFKEFKQQFSKYANFQSRQGRIKEGGNLEAVINPRSNYYNIVLLNGEHPSPQRDSIFFKGLKRAQDNGNLIFVNFGSSNAIANLDSSYTCIQAYHLSDDMEKFAVQIIFGALDPNGKLPVKINPSWPQRSGKNQKKIRLAFSEAQEAGIRPEKLVGINAIAAAAIRKKATPGAQVAVIKDGHLIYSQSFGHHTYKKKQRVKKTDLFDVASITKVGATTLMLMHHYQNGQYKINDRIKSHLPEYKKATFRNTRIKDIMTHQSGIQPHLPVIPYLLYRKSTNTACDSFFCKTESPEYSVQVADEFYFQKDLQDSIWIKINDVKVSNRRSYRYSDVNFALMQRLVESKDERSLDEQVNQHFYGPLGLRRTTFNPLKKFEKEEILPSERDKKWRHQQIHGFVHDETAALFGGVAGHAGLFSTAEELATIMQMLLEQGSYGGRTYFQPETIELFTSAKHGNHRGLGFDKRHSSNRSGRAYDMGTKAFGHTGFTGTCAWVDPEHNLVYVFLSNRVFPNARNGKLFRERTRARIHQVIYDSIDSYDHHWPDLNSP